MILLLISIIMVAQGLRSLRYTNLDLENRRDEIIKLAKMPIIYYCFSLFLIIDGLFIYAAFKQLPMWFKILNILIAMIYFLSVFKVNKSSYYFTFFIIVLKVILTNLMLPLSFETIDVAFVLISSLGYFVLLKFLFDEYNLKFKRKSSISK